MITLVPILIVQMPRNQLCIAYVKQLQSGSFMSDGQKNQPFFPKALWMAKEGVLDTGTARMDEEMVEIGSMEFAVAAVIAEAEALDPAMLEEARRRMDWLKWDLAIKAELEALKKVGTWGVIERPKGRNIFACKWYCTSRRMQLGRSSTTRPNSLEKDSLRSMVWIIMRPWHLSQSMLLFKQYLPSLLTIIGPSTCSTSTVLSLTGNLMRMKKYSWSNCLAIKNPTCINVVSSCTSHSMDLNKPDTNGTRSLPHARRTGI